MTAEKISEMINLLEEFKKEFKRPEFPYDLNSYMAMEEYTSVTGRIDGLIELANWLVEDK